MEGMARLKLTVSHPVSEKSRCIHPAFFPYNGRSVMQKQANHGICSHHIAQAPMRLAAAPCHQNVFIHPDDPDNAACARTISTLVGDSRQQPSDVGS